MTSFSNEGTIVTQSPIGLNPSSQRDISESTKWLLKIESLKAKDYFEEGGRKDYQETVKGKGSNDFEDGGGEGKEFRGNIAGGRENLLMKTT